MQDQNKSYKSLQVASNRTVLEPFIFEMDYFQRLCGTVYKTNSYITSLASITVPTPTVKACLGTLLISFPKNRAFASSVSCANVLTRVRDTRDDPGSLNAICPSGPIPINNEHRNCYLVKSAEYVNKHRQ